MPLTLDRQNTYRAHYARLRPGWQPATAVYEHLIREALAARAASSQPPTVLDLGCGRGGVLEQLHDLPLHAVGLDPDFASLAEHRLPGLPRAQAAAGAIPLAAASVDVLICAWVLEHLPDPARVFAEARRVLRPGGLFICLAPNKASPVALLNRLLKPLQRALVPRLYGRAEADTFPVVYRANTRRAITRLAAESGLTLHTFRYIDDPTYLAFNALLFRLSVWLTRLLPPTLAVHFVSVCQREST